MRNQVLFLGITNYCASRFAEILFNQMGSEVLLKFQGISRGVLLKHQETALDPRCLGALAARGIPLPSIFRKPLPLKPQDLQLAEYIVLVNGLDLKHRILRSNEIDEKQLIMWDFHDVGITAPSALFPALEAEVHLLIRRIQHSIVQEHVVRAWS